MHPKESCLQLRACCMVVVPIDVYVVPIALILMCQRLGPPKKNPHLLELVCQFQKVGGFCSNLASYFEE